MQQLVGIVATDRKNVIGSEGSIPWRLSKEDRHKFSEDMQRFKELTSGHKVIMGRKTYDSLGKPLPNRENIVLSKSLKPKEGIVVVHSLDEALERVGDDLAWVIGGETVYQLFLPYMNRVEKTVINASYSGDAYFPLLSPKEWRLAWSQDLSNLRFEQYLRR